MTEDKNLRLVIFTTTVSGPLAGYETTYASLHAHSMIKVSFVQIKLTYTDFSFDPLFKPKKRSLKPN